MVDEAKAQAAPARPRRRRKAATAGPVAEAAPLRGRIPAMPAARAQALRALFRAPQGRLLGDNGLLQLMPGRPAAPAEVFELDAEGTRVGLRLQATAVALGDGLHWSDFNGRSRILAWSLAHEGHLMRLSEALGVALAPLLDADAQDAPADGEALWLDFLIDDEHPGDDADAARRAPAMHGSLRLPLAWIERLLVRAEPPFEDDSPQPLGRWGRLPATVSLQFGIPPLAPADLEALSPGAVFVVGRSGRRPAFQARACGHAWPVVPAAGGWRIDGPAQPIPTTQESDPMSEQQPPAGDGGQQGPASAPADPEAGTRKLPVEVSFEIGRLQMPVGKLAELQAGYVFPVPAQLEGANVTIRANGEAVGQGELVSVGDTLGVRLLSWK